MEYAELFIMNDKLTIENLKNVTKGGRIVGMEKNLRHHSYLIDILFQHKVRTCSVTPETYYQLSIGMNISVGMDLPLPPSFTGTNA